MGYLHLTAMGAENIAQFSDPLLPRLPRPAGDRRRRPRERRRLDRVLRHRQARAEGDGLRRPQEHRAVPVPARRLEGALRVRDERVHGSDGERSSSTGRPRSSGPSSGSRRGAASSGSSTGRRRSTAGRSAESNNSFYGSAGTWLVENHGADPDVLLENDPASASAGKDLQLEKAVEVLKKEIAERPFTFPPKPAYPVR